MAFTKITRHLDPLLVLLGLAAFAALSGKYIEAGLFVVSYIVLFYRFSKHIHYSGKFGWALMVDWSCVAMSILLGSLSIYVSPSLGFSLIAPVFVALSVLCLGYALAERKELLFRFRAFDPDHCTEDELRERCIKCFPRDTEYKTERAIKHFILKLPHSEIDTNPRQSEKERERMRKQLKS